MTLYILPKGARPAPRPPRLADPSTEPRRKGRPPTAALRWYERLGAVARAIDDLHYGAQQGGLPSVVRNWTDEALARNLQAVRNQIARLTLWERAMVQISERRAAGEPTARPTSDRKRREA